MYSSFPNDTSDSGYNILNSSVCQNAWEHSNQSEYYSNASFNALMTQCIGTVLGADRTNFWTAYCNNPPNDNCPYGYCPNTDVAGQLTRIAAYITSFATACVLAMVENRPDVVWAQLLTIYSILISTFISVLHGNQLGRVHAELALLIVGSPLTCYLWLQTIYSLIWFRRFKWDATSIARTILLISAFVIYTLFVVFTLVDKAGNSMFSQESCYKKKVGLFAPFFLLTNGGVVICGAILLFVNIFILVEWNRRKSAWLEKRGFWYLTWENVKGFRRRMWAKYAHTRFFAFSGLPFVTWVLVTEVTAATNGGVILGAVITFGSLLTLMASLPPILAIFQVAAAIQAARRKTVLEVAYEKAHTFDTSEDGIDLSVLSKHSLDYGEDAGGPGFRQWCKDLGRAIVVGWRWIILSMVIAGLAILCVLFAYRIAESYKAT